jgi:hypothetical protein
VLGVLSIGVVNACGEATHGAPPSAEPTATGGELGRAGASYSGGGSGPVTRSGAAHSAGAETGGAADPVVPAPDVMALDASNCEERKLASCENALTFYSSGDLGATPELAACAQFGSVDGCERVTFAFDAAGCAMKVTAVPSPLRHLEPLRACLADALARTRWPCLASNQLTYDEGCFYR